MLVLAMKEDRNASVRFEAIRALGKIGDTSAAKDVLPFTLSTESKLRTEAALTVGRLHDQAALPELTRLFMKEAALQKRQADAPFRAALMEAIALIADPSSKELFTRQRAHDDAAVRVQAYAGLARVGDASLTTAVSQERLSETEPKCRPPRPSRSTASAARSTSRSWSRRSARGGHVGAGPRIPARAAPGGGRRPRRAVAARGAGLRESMAEILGLIGDDRARPVLQELTRDTRGQVAPLASRRWSGSPRAAARRSAPPQQPELGRGRHNPDPRDLDAGDRLFAVQRDLRQRLDDRHALHDAAEHRVLVVERRAPCPGR